jgi:leader peptidase (prepilin peptidase)/N-methyltransferase
MTAVVAPLSAPSRTVRATDVLLAALGAAAILVAFAKSSDLMHGLAIALDLTVLWGIAWWDSRTLRAPNVAVGAGLLVAIVIAAAVGPGALLDAVAGGSVLFVVMLGIMALGRGAMGAGDVKFAALAGIVVGIQGALPLLFTAFITGGIVAAVALGFRLRKRKDPIAFTPFLAAGALIALTLYPVYLTR